MTGPRCRHGRMCSRPAWRSLSVGRRVRGVLRPWTIRLCPGAERTRALGPTNVSSAVASSAVLSTTSADVPFLGHDARSSRVVRALRERGVGVVAVPPCTFPAPNTSVGRAAADTRRRDAADGDRWPPRGPSLQRTSAGRPTSIERFPAPNTSAGRLYAAPRRGCGERGRALFRPVERALVRMRRRVEGHINLVDVRGGRGREGRSREERDQGERGRPRKRRSKIFFWSRLK